MIPQITLIAGDTKIINVKAKKTIIIDGKETEKDIDLSGATVYLGIQIDKDDIIKKEVTTHTNPTKGESQVILLPNDTKNIKEGSYKYILRVKNYDNSVFSLGISDIIIKNSIIKIE